MLVLIHKEFHHCLCRVSHRGTRTEDCGNTCFVEEVIILCRDDTTGNDHDVLTSELLQLLKKLRDKSLVTGSKG